MVNLTQVAASADEAEETSLAANYPPMDMNDLSTDELANIFGCLGPVDIMRLRCVCKKWRDTATNTIVPPAPFVVHNVKSYNAMKVMMNALPNLQGIKLADLGCGHKYVDGEDPNETFAELINADSAANRTDHDIEIIANITKLRILEIGGGAPLNGRYPFLFNFPLLQKLTVTNCMYIKLDLEMLAGLPLLEELKIQHNQSLTGNVGSLRPLKDTMEKVKIYNCSRVEGNFMDLADFPHLKDLNLDETAVTGDIRDIGAHDFTSLETLYLPEGVVGGDEYEFRHVSDVPSVMQAIYQLMKRTPPILRTCKWYLSPRSSDWYHERDEQPPPFVINFIPAGPRLGWRWRNRHGQSCEINWLDPEPEKESSDYEMYVQELKYNQEGVVFYSGYHGPPTEEEYNRLCDEYGNAKRSGDHQSENI